MIRQEFKRRNVTDHKKQQFAAPAYGPQEYPYRLNLYDRPPTAEITLEQFEQWAIDRLRSNISCGIPFEYLSCHCGTDDVQFLLK
ncbi:hypothetical protein CK516_05505 [Nostoc sp. 'Peltigera malacea cyanobiont' DB3992]|nr:hypothetical protein CK516_05505 [Nostoc sp. 'Peltigera malacea cyanobiont' DB3992]